MDRKARPFSLGNQMPISFWIIVAAAAIIPSAIVLYMSSIFHDPFHRPRNRYWTDYPIRVGREGEADPVLPVILLAYDGDKYVKVVVEGQKVIQFKQAYLYMSNFNPETQYPEPVPQMLLDMKTVNNQKWLAL